MHLANIEEVLRKLQSQHTAPIEAIDWDAPEAGQFPPHLQPGVYTFAFKLPDDANAQFDTVHVGDFDYLSVTHEAEIQDPKDPAKPVTLKFCRASLYKHEKMPISMLGDLLRSLGLRTRSNPPSEDEVISVLQEASGRASGKAELGWRRYCKACDLTVSTHPKKDQVKWPRAADHKPELIVACPGCGERGYGREEIVRYKLPSEKAVAAS